METRRTIIIGIIVLGLIGACSIVENRRVAVNRPDVRAVKDAVAGGSSLSHVPPLALAGGPSEDLRDAVAGGIVADHAAGASGEASVPGDAVDPQRSAAGGFSVPPRGGAAGGFGLSPRGGGGDGGFGPPPRGSGARGFVPASSVVHPPNYRPPIISPAGPTPPSEQLPE